MKLVHELLSPPHSCAVIPGRGVEAETDGFIDTMNDMPAIDPHIYVSVRAVREMGELIGMKSVEDYDQAIELAVAAQDRIETLEAELAEADRALEGVEVLTRRAEREQTAA